ncbi:MAG: DUF4428 domain-containing protein [Eggerthellales bacterium]|nr:DUF4428 domain-containing protein [Eggerthellales bacterium]
MGLFDAIKNAVAEKECSICSGDAGRVFAKKLEDGYLCKECTDKLSPWFSDRRSSTVAQIQEQLDYREANKADVEAFQVTKTLNGNYKILIDEDKGNFVVTRASNWRAANPDVIPLSAITGCTYEVDETKRDVTPEPEHKEGEPEPEPIPMSQHIFEYDYDFNITINVNHKYFDEISFQVNDTNVDQRYSSEYINWRNTCEEIKETLCAARTESRAAAAAAAAPKVAKQCPYCGATTFPDASGCCEYCGGAMGA